MKNLTQKLHKLLISWVLVIIACVGLTPYAFALDKDGNFESIQEQDAFIAAELKKAAIEMNSQTPISLNEETQLLSVMAIQKTMTLSHRLTQVKATDVDPNYISQEIRKNLNYMVCGNKAVQDMIDFGVVYTYIYNDINDRFVTRIVISSYNC